ncbi:hypothetical protein LCGC14_1387980 [marine sediment metagenome]|uniref:Uncharacterized protein n=1 Tax=marine sediment metagenome TaxID=412755 RepID=A0A0F9N2C1_9ZZZZ
MTEKMTVSTYDLDHENQARWTGHLDGEIIITVEAGGRGVQIKLPPRVAAELADNLAKTVLEVLAQDARMSPAGHA